MIEISGPLLNKFNPESSCAKDLNSIADALSKKDSSLWGENAKAEAAVRLNWLDLPRSSKELLPRLNELKNWAESNTCNQIILCGMGGSSLAPEVFGKSYSKNISILDSTDPEQITYALRKGLKNSIIVIGSKSGSTIETSSQKLLFENELQKAGLDPKNHIVIITDPGSPLDVSAKKDGYQVVNADPKVGGRFSALSAFGLVPAVLLGIDVMQILTEAEAAAKIFNVENSVAIKVATLLMEQSNQVIAFSDFGSNVPGLSDWIEQLIAESTGKDGVGRLPVVIENSGSEISGNYPLIAFSKDEGDLSVIGTLAEHFIFWEWVTALLGRALKVDPFNQPNVTEAKERTSALLDKWNGEIQSPQAIFEDETLAIFSNDSANSLDEALVKFLAPASGYISIMAYLNREQDHAIANIRGLIADKSKRPVTFGWGPRFLHSTGQFHKGGQPNGAFIQITAESFIDIEVPGKSYSFQTLFMAQALGDGEALSSRNLPLIRIHLKDRAAGIAKLLEAVKKL